MNHCIQSWLLSLCDPEGVHELPVERLAATDLEPLFRLAAEHGVRGAVMMNLKWLIDQHAADRVLLLPAHGARLTSLIEQAQHECRAEVAYGLLLRARAAELLDRFHRAGHSAAIVKGEDFADRLYGRADLRTFRDIDIMMPLAAIDQVHSIMTEMKFRSVVPPGKYSADYGERTWDSLSQPLVRIELHWNMITCPSQRRVSSLAHEAIEWESSPHGERATAESMLLIAVVHAAISHRFDRLQHLVDVRQICRGRASRLNIDKLRERAARNGLSNVLVGVLQLTASLLQDRSSQRVLDELAFSVRHRRLWRVLVDGHLLLAPNTRVNKLRRGLLREWMKRAA